MKLHKPHILFLGEWGFPIGFGAIQRMQLIAKGIIKHGCRATVLCFKGSHGPDQNFDPIGEFEGIDYRYTSGSIYKPSGFLKRNWMKFSGRVNELKYIRAQKERGELDGCLVSTMYIEIFLIYWFWFKLNGIPLVLNYDELNSKIPSRTGLWNKVNDYLFDRLTPILADGICPISEYLIDHVQRYRPQKPIYKLPILCEFEKFDIRSEEKEKGISFVYCGAASYLELILFVLEAFDFLEIQGKAVFLDFVLGGSKSELERAKQVIGQSNNHSLIRITTNVSHKQIPYQYAKASALLIPMRPTIQDAARFPHKIGEYLASGKAVITTNFGEIRHYDFIDQKTALVAEAFDPEVFAKKMQFVVDHPEETKQIGLRGREMGLKNFNYVDIGGKVKDFILSLNK